MNLKESVLERLNELLTRGSLPRSGCSNAFLGQIDPLLESGVLSEQRSGSGRRLVVVDQTALQSFVAKYYPALQVSDEALSREIALARFRDTKALRSDTPEIISVRTWCSDALSFNDADQKDNVLARRPCFDPVQATRDLGVFSFLLRKNCQIRLAGKWALVENPAAFVHFERLGLQIHGVLYSRGRISNRLLEWLALQPAGFEVLHLPDYDPAGILDYQRLSLRLGKRATLYLPDDLDTRFAKLSNPDLLRKDMTRSLLASLSESTQPEIRKVIDLIQRHNAGLEQEALLIPVR